MWAITANDLYKSYILQTSANINDTNKINKFFSRVTNFKRTHTSARQKKTYNQCTIMMIHIKFAEPLLPVSLNALIFPSQA